MPGTLTLFMADKLFEYFLVYSTEWKQPALEQLNADDFFQQIWGEYIFSLKNQGFHIVSDFSIFNGTIQINVDLLHRAFDNIYSNILKYADRQKTVAIRYFRKQDEICLTIANAVSPDRNIMESTNIGLNTCKRIIQYHGGSFQATENGNEFVIIITIPFMNTKTN